MIIDTHVHVWEIDPPRYPVGPTAPNWTAEPDEPGVVGGVVSLLECFFGFEDEDGAAFAEGGARGILRHGMDRAGGVVVGTGVEAFGHRLSEVRHRVEPAVRAAAEVVGADRLTSVRGVLNGTCNYLVNELARGVAFPKAVAEAQRLGYAEADPTMDLDGTDAAQKIQILGRAALGVEIPFAEIGRETLDPASADEVARRWGAGDPVRQVASLERRLDGGVTASVTYRSVRGEGPLAHLPGALNAMLVRSQSGRAWQVVGSGAGQGPTAESVFADLTDLIAIR